MADKVRVAIVGLGFGAEFIPIYQAHPERRDVRHLPPQQGGTRRTAATSSASRTATPTYDELLEDPNVDAVHINCPIPDHAPQAIAALKAGKHVACTVPMGASDRRVQADRRGPAEERQGLHDDGDRRLQPRVPVRQGAVRQGRAGPDSVPARQPSAGHGRLARLLARPAADVLRHPLRQPVPGDPGDPASTTPRASSATARAASARS